MCVIHVLSTLLDEADEFRTSKINAKDKANQTPLSVRLIFGPSQPRISCRVRHRAATTGSTGMIAVLLKPPQGAPKTRLNTADRIGAEPPSL